MVYNAQQGGLIVDTTQQANAEQIALWNDTAGRAWVETQETLDAVLQPFEDLLVEAIAKRKAQRVLDVGCGTGSTTLAGSAGATGGSETSTPAGSGGAPTTAGSASVVMTPSNAASSGDDGSCALHQRDASAKDAWPLLGLLLLALRKRRRLSA